MSNRSGLPIPFVVSVVVAVALVGFALGRVTAPGPRLINPPSVTTAATGPSAAARAAVARPAPADEEPAPSAPAPPAPSAALAVARRIAGLSGEPLIAALWDLEGRMPETQVTFAMLERNAERYRGQGAIFTGEVLEISDLPDGGAFMRLGLDSYGQRVLAIGMLVPPGDDIVRGRRVRVYGELQGTFTYTSQARWEISIPKLIAVAVVPSAVPRRPGRQ